MSMLKTGGLALAFTLVADVAMAGGLGMIGVHGFVVDAGVSLGQEWGVPQVDWTNLWENQEFSFLDPETDPCLLQPGGHYHGDVCHVGTDKIAQLSPTSLTPPTPAAPAAQPLEFE